MHCYLLIPLAGYCNGDHAKDILCNMSVVPSCGRHAEDRTTEDTESYTALHLLVLSQLPAACEARDLQLAAQKLVLPS